VTLSGTRVKTLGRKPRIGDNQQIGTIFDIYLMQDEQVRKKLLFSYSVQRRLPEKGEISQRLQEALGKD